jgi:hypothetical protein
MKRKRTDFQWDRECAARPHSLTLKVHQPIDGSDFDIAVTFFFNVVPFEVILFDWGRDIENSMNVFPAVGTS